MGKISLPQLNKLSRNFYLIGLVMVVIGFLKWQASSWNGSFLAGIFFIALAMILTIYSIWQHKKNKR